MIWPYLFASWTSVQVLCLQMMARWIRACPVCRESAVLLWHHQDKDMCECLTIPQWQVFSMLIQFIPNQSDYSCILQVFSTLKEKTLFWSGNWVKELLARCTWRNVPTSVLILTRCWLLSRYDHALCYQGLTFLSFQQYVMFFKAMPFYVPEKYSCFYWNVTFFLYIKHVLISNDS